MEIERNESENNEEGEVIRNSRKIEKKNRTRLATERKVEKIADDKEGDK